VRQSCCQSRASRVLSQGGSAGFAGEFQHGILVRLCTIKTVAIKTVSKTLSKQVTVNSPQGLHARPAYALVEMAGQFRADIEIIRNGEKADGKSILAILGLAAEQGTQLIIQASGEDAAQAVEALAELVLEDVGQDDEPTPKNESTKTGDERGEPSSINRRD